MLYFQLDSIHKAHPEAGPYSYVDNLARAARGADPIKDSQQLGRGAVDLFD